MRIWGIPVARRAIKALVATLVADGSPDAMAAAGRISKRLDEGSDGLIALKPQHRGAILAVARRSARRAERALV